MARLGYQVPDLTTPDGDVFPNLVAQAGAAEAAGFDSLFVMDHFYQLPMLGALDEPMLEAYTLLSALAQHTDTISLGALVTGVTYRNPALLAKEVTTLDHVSNGRAILGIGAGWFEPEHDAYGFEFGTFTDRFEKLEEALQIVGPMLRGEPATLAGDHHVAREAINSPAPIGDVPVLIGGSGERKTLRMVAQYADESNLVGIAPEDAADVIPRKFAALEGHCARLGRDRDEITVTLLVSCNVAETTDQAEQDLRAWADLKGWDGDQVVAGAGRRMVHGDPEAVAARLADVMATGLDGLVLNAPANGRIPGRVELLGEVASSVM